MIELAQSRTARFRGRAAIQETSGATRVDLPDGVFDRFIFAHREGHREQAADATDGQLAEYLATDVALQGHTSRKGILRTLRSICTAIPRRLWSPQCCRTKARSAFVSVYLRINSASSSGKASNCIRSDEVRISRRGIVLECTENDHFHERNTHLKWLFATPRRRFLTLLTYVIFLFLRCPEVFHAITGLQIPFWQFSGEKLL